MDLNIAYRVTPSRRSERSGLESESYFCKFHYTVSPYYVAYPKKYGITQMSIT